jgi:hypothetical protein
MFGLERDTNMTKNKKNQISGSSFRLSTYTELQLSTLNIENIVKKETPMDPNLFGSYFRNESVAITLHTKMKSDINVTMLIIDLKVRLMVP